MEKIDLKHKDAARALDALRDILVEPYSVIVRDAAIQRFEFTFEAVWKYVKEEVSQLIYNKLPPYSRTLTDLFGWLLPGRNGGSEPLESR